VAGEHSKERSPVHVTAARGFTLLEVLVALAIATLALGALFSATLTGLQSTQAASQYQQAVARARSHLTAAVHATPLTAGDWQGDDGGGFAWHLHVVPIARTVVRPISAAALNGIAGIPLSLYLVTVRITWRDRQVRLETEQIGQAPR
jgi:prepilin-type N-terminal cleavage/methylation domain-containing protein